MRHGHTRHTSSAGQSENIKKTLSANQAHSKYKVTAEESEASGALQVISAIKNSDLVRL